MKIHDHKKTLSSRFATFLQTVIWLSILVFISLFYLACELDEGGDNTEFAFACGSFDLTLSPGECVVIDGDIITVCPNSGWGDNPARKSFTETHVQFYPMINSNGQQLFCASSNVTAPFQDSVSYTVSTTRLDSFGLEYTESASNVISVEVLSNNPCVEDGDCIDDGDFCNGEEICMNETCVSEGSPCDEGVCDEVEDICLPEGSCSQDEDCFDDGIFCNGNEVCLAGECVSEGSPCDGGPCDEEGETCPAESECLADEDCDNGQFCDGEEICVSGTCQAGPAPIVDDNVACTNDFCDEENDVVVNSPDNSTCDNGFFCDGAEFCDPTLDCQVGSPCDTPACDEELDICLECNTTQDCGDDGNFCNGIEVCQNGSCVSLGNPCDEGICDEVSDSCTECVTDADCLDDGLFCNGEEVCQSGSCVSTGSPCDGVGCNEINDFCGPCEIDADCNDNVFCNGIETCVAGTCIAGTPSICDDGISCTIDSCDPTSDTCQSTPDNSLCLPGESCNLVADCTSADMALSLVDMDLVGVGRQATLLMTLSNPAPTGGITITVTSDDAATVGVEAPGTITIAEGDVQGTILLNGTAPGFVTVRGNAPGLTEATLPIEVTSSLISLASGVVVAPGNTANLAVSLSQPAPVGGATVLLQSSDASIATVDPSVFIPGGQQVPNSSPQITGIDFGVVQITGRASGFASALVDVTVSLTLNLVPATLTLPESNSTNITLQLSDPAQPGGLTISLSTDDPTIATVPPSFLVNAGQSSASVLVTGISIGNTTLRAAAPGVPEASAIINVTPAPSITIPLQSIGDDLQIATFGNLGAPAPAGNLLVTITSSDPTRLLLATNTTSFGSASINLNVAAGSSDIPTFFVQALDDSGTVDIVATAPGYATSTTAMNLTPSGFIFNSPTTDFSTSTLDPNTVLQIASARLDPVTLEWQQNQQVRGGLTVNVPIVSSDSTVGSITTSPIIFNGGDTSQNTEFDPLTTGITALTVSPPAGFDTPDNFQSIEATVTPDLVPVFDLAVSKLDTPDPVIVNNSLTYSLQVTNNGPEDALDVLARDQLPTLPSGALVTFVSASPSQGSCSESGGFVDCSLGTIPVGTNVDISIVVIPTEATSPGFSPLSALASVTSLSPSFSDIDPSNNSASEETIVLANTGGNQTPIVSIDSMTLAEGSTGSTTFIFTVTLTQPASADITVNYSTSDDSAIAAENDYTPASGTLVFPAGTNTAQSIPVVVHGDMAVELSEIFFVNLSAPTNATLGNAQGIGTIVNDDSATLSINDVFQDEGDSGMTNFVFSVSLSAEVDTGISVDFTTADATALVADNDYNAISGTLNFVGTAGEAQTIRVEVLTNDFLENDETFFINLSNLIAGGRDVTLIDAQGLGTIVNDDFCLLTAVRWVTNADGFWHEPTNWSTGFVPGVSDDVCIDVAGDITVTHNQNAVPGGDAVNHLVSNENFVISAGSLDLATDSRILQDFTLDGGILTGLGNLTVDGVLTWVGGTMSGSGSTFANGGMNLSGSSRTIGSSAGTGRTLVNAGNAIWTSGNFSNFVNGTLVNVISGTLTIQGDQDFIGGVFINEGLVAKSLGAAGNDETRFTSTFDNTGSVDVQQGRLALEAGGISSGSFDATGAELSFGGSLIHTLQSTATVGGRILFEGTRIEFISGATFVNPGTSVVLSSGTVDLSSGAGHSVDAFTQSAGTLQGSDDLTITGLTTWTGGTMGGSGTTFANGGMDLSGSSRTIGSSTGPGRAVVNAGLAIWISGNFSNFTNSTFSNAASGTLDILGDQDFSAGTFNNSGLIIKSIGAGGNQETHFSSTFNNNGTVDVQQGRLALDAGGISSGSFDTTGAELSFGGSSIHTLQATAIVGGRILFEGTRIEFISGATFMNPGTSVVLSSGTVDLSSGAGHTVDAFTQSAGTLQGSDDLTITGLTTWTGGIMGGSGTVFANGGMDLDGATKTIGSNTGTGRTVVNAGSATWISGTFSNFANGTFTNAATGTFDIQGDQDFFLGTFNNQGNFLKSIGAGGLQETRVTAAFNNSGAVDVQQGRLALDGGGVNTGSYNGSGGEISFGGASTHTLQTSATLGGTVIFEGTRIHVETGATFANAGAMIMLASGTLDLSSGIAHTVSTYTQSGGTLQGSDTITVSGLTTWTGGAMGGSGTTIADGGMDLDGTTKTIGSSTGTGRTVVNAGSATWISGAFSNFANGTFTNAAAGTFDIQGDQDFFLGTFNNQGNFLKSIGAGGIQETRVTGAFNNSGAVDVQQGRLALDSGGVNTGSYNGSGGEISFGGTPNHMLQATATINGTVIFEGTRINFETGATFTNPGARITVASGTVDLSSGIAHTVTTYTQPGGTLQGSDTITVSGLTTWTGGTMGGSGTTFANGGMDLDGTTKTIGSNTGTGRTVVNTGSATWISGSFSNFANGSFINAASGTFDIQGDSDFFLGTFTNQGNFLKTIGAGGVQETRFTSSFANSGSVDVQQGTLALDGGFTQTAGTTTLTGGNLDSNNSIDIQGGSLEGTGNLTGNISNTGIIIPGSTIGLIDVTGTYNQQGSGSLEIELAGTATAGTDFDQFNITNTATLAGDLNVSLAGGFTPALGDSFLIMTYSSLVGTFTNINLPALAGLNWDVAVDPTGITLTVVP